MQNESRFNKSPFPKESFFEQASFKEGGSFSKRVTSLRLVLSRRFFLGYLDWFPRNSE